MNRDERRLLAVIAVVIVAALIAIVQIESQRAGVTSPITSIGGTLLDSIENAGQATIGGITGAATALLRLPELSAENRLLIGQNALLAEANAQLAEQVSAYKETAALQPVSISSVRTIPARQIGFPPENESRTITIDRGSHQGIEKDDGVLAAGGVIGIVQTVGPFSSTVVLITDYTSRIPVMVQRGRWWGIARGNLTSVRVEYIKQDAPLHIGDAIVTGEGRSFHSGAMIGTIMSIERNDASLYQTAVVKPAVDLGALDRFVVVPK